MDCCVVKMYFEMFQGFSEGSKLKVMIFLNEEGYKLMVMEKYIFFYLMCFYYLVLFYGYVYMVYVFGDKIVGLFKFVCVFDFYVKWLQLQECLMEQVVEFFESEFKFEGVMVVIEVCYFCVEMCGVKKFGLVIVIFVICGIFYEWFICEEFFDFLRIKL